jgi:hypothetical protein
VDVQWAPVRAFNALAGRLPRLSPDLPVFDDLVAEAARQAPGATAPAPEDDGWRPGLAAFLAALRSEADLTPAGRRFAHGAIVSALVNRMSVEQAVAADAAIVGRPVGPAIVVVGLPRSGTTLLQHLLSLDPDNRSLRQWEAVRPVPPPGADPVADAQRIRAAERSTWLGDHLTPHARVLHPTGPRLPTECVSLFSHSFASLELAVLYHVPSYTRWCLQTDMRPHYAFYARQLQVLARHERRSRWALKSPAHLFWIDELTTALPESRVVALHRDPLDVLSSFCRLVTVLTSVTKRRPAPHEVGALWSGVWAEGLRRATAARSRLPADRWIDVQYDDLLTDPVGTVAAVYEAFGYRFGPGFANAIRDHVAAHPQRRSGVHYSLADFGLDPEEQRERFLAAEAPASAAGVPDGMRHGMHDRPTTSAARVPMTRDQEEPAS